jgi:hypothetical protein
MQPSEAGGGQIARHFPGAGGKSHERQKRYQHGKHKKRRLQRGKPAPQPKQEGQGVSPWKDEP